MPRKILSQQNEKLDHRAKFHSQKLNVGMHEVANSMEENNHDLKATCVKGDRL